MSTSNSHPLANPFSSLYLPIVNYPNVAPTPVATYIPYNLWGRNAYYKAYVDPEIFSLTKDMRTRGSLWPLLKPYLLKTKAMRSGAPTPMAHALLMGCTDKGVSSVFTRSIPEFCLATFLGLVIKIPAVPKKHRARFRTYSVGIQLLQHWAETQPKFQPFYDAFVSKKSVDNAYKWAVEYATDFVPLVVAKKEAEANLFYNNSGV